MTALALPFPATSDGNPTRPGLFAGLLQRRAARRDAQIDEWLHHREAIDLGYRWRAACERAPRMTRPISTPLGGFAPGGAPRVVHVDPGAYGINPYMIVERPPGVTDEDLTDAVPELAAGVGAWDLRFTPRGPRYLRVDLVMRDPLSQLVPFLPTAPWGHLVIGVDEHGRVVSFPLDQLTHVVAQGATRTGKSWWAYATLAQLRPRPDVDVVGIDPTRLILGPWGAHPRGWRATGTDDDAPLRYELALAGIVDEMDRRIRSMPPRCDVLPTGPHCPLLLVVLEEWPGVGRIVGHTRNKPAATHKLTARIASEGAKAGIRLVTLAQRAEADAVGVAEREQALTCITFGPTSVDTLKMLHGAEATPELAERQAECAQGVGVLSLPGRGLLRFRAPAIGSYGAYVDLVGPDAVNDSDVSPSARLHDQAA